MNYKKLMEREPSKNVEDRREWTGRDYQAQRLDEMYDQARRGEPTARRGKKLPAPDWYRKERGWDK